MIEYVPQPDDNIRVVAIPDSFTIIVNAGTKIGIAVGDKVEITAKGVEIEDPKTGEILGTYGGAKERLDVEQATDKMSVCGKSHGNSVLTNQYVALATVMQSAMFGTSRTALNVNENEVGLPDEPEDVTISIGNKVKWLKRVETPDPPSEDLPSDT